MDSDEEDFSIVFEEDDWITPVPKNKRFLFIPTKIFTVSIVDKGYFKTHEFMCETPCTSCDAKKKILVSCSNSKCYALTCFSCVVDETKYGLCVGCNHTLSIN